MGEHRPTGHSRRDLAAVIVALALPSAITWVYFFGVEGAPAGTQLLVFNAVKILQFAFPLVWVLAVQRERVGAPRARREGVAVGLAFGAIVAIAIFALYAGVLKSADAFVGAAAEIRDKVAGFGIVRTWQYAALGLFYSLFHSLLEEYYWRWFVFGQLRRSTALRTAIGVSALGFMAHHVLVLGKFFGFGHPATYLLASCVAVGGAAWAWLYDRSGSLIGPWVSHLLVDAAIFAVGYDLVRDQLG
jgi:membrane protease YdiL (CAAX protease family)